MKTSFIKNHFGLLSLFAGLMLIYIYWAQSATQRGLFFSNENLSSEIHETITQFRLTSKPVAEINFSEIYGNSGQFQILHPLLSIKRPHLANCKNCSEKQTESEETKEAFTFAKDKRRQLEFFLSGSAPLPNDFFLKPPFADQQGSSYAYLISMYPTLLEDEKAWVEQHLSYFKISELKEVLQKYQINDLKFLILSRFSELEVESVIRGEEVILTSDYVLFKDQDRLGFSPLSYLVYSATEFNQAVKNGKFEVSPEIENRTCILKIGNSCWTYNSRQTQAYFYRYSFTIILLIGLFLLSVLGFYIKSLYEKNKAQLKHRLSLQVLSHEFRTPVSAMLLLIEQMTAKQNKLDPETQDLIVRLSAEVFRMQRIIEVSKTYLQTESHRIQFNNVEIPSVNSWISDFILDSNKDISSELLPEDHSLIVDPFWLKFILSNLVQNAFIHGKSPVVIKLQKNKNQLKILVQDQGKNEFESLEQMTEAFVKSPRSQGMGLGLNMILFIVDQWGARLLFSKNPTVFTLILPLRGKN
ncbi:MAG: HAMP domain-containing histidine kinase [Pseudobdellovibrio sp.]|nr:HAMP domain-containing histidine kinase [Pseudobdellovibrio sp.]